MVDISRDSTNTFISVADQPHKCAFKAVFVPSRTLSISTVPVHTSLRMLPQYNLWRSFGNRDKLSNHVEYRERVEISALRLRQSTLNERPIATDSTCKNNSTTFIQKHNLFSPDLPVWSHQKPHVIVTKYVLKKRATISDIFLSALFVPCQFAEQEVSCFRLSCRYSFFLFSLRFVPITSVNFTVSFSTALHPKRIFQNMSQLALQRSE